MRTFFIALSAMLLWPSLVLAQSASTTSTSSPQATLAAGFATAPLWISSASPTVGDALKIFAVVNNASLTAVTGSVSFLVDGVVAGSAEKISLASGAAQIVSAQWKAVVGTHALTATFGADQAGQVLGTAGPVSITVAPAPPAPAVVQYLTAAVDMSGGAVDKALQTLEDMRQNGADYFASQSSGVAPTSQVLGTTTENTASGTTPAASEATGASLFNRLGSLIFENPLLFYPFILLICFFVLWIILKLFSRD